jgi:hypothetical protein
VSGARIARVPRAKPCEFLQKSGRRLAIPSGQPVTAPAEALDTSFAYFAIAPVL